MEVNITENSTIVNTSTFNGWTPPFVTVNLPLQDFTMLPLTDPTRIILNILRNASTILPTKIASVSAR